MLSGRPPAYVPAFRDNRTAGRNRREMARRARTVCSGAGTGSHRGVASRQEPQTLGYERSLFVLALDRRGSLPRQMFGFGAAPTPQETATIADAKSVIFDGFSRALTQGAPTDTAGILVDEQYGAEIARTALARGCIVAMPVERSDRPSFEFEYGDEFAAHIEAFDPTFSKVLVRFNPEGDAADNRPFDRGARGPGRLASLARTQVASRAPRAPRGAPGGGGGRPGGVRRRSASRADAPGDRDAAGRRGRG